MFFENFGIVCCLPTVPYIFTVLYNNVTFCTIYTLYADLLAHCFALVVEGLCHHGDSLLMIGYFYGRHLTIMWLLLASLVVFCYFLSLNQLRCMYRPPGRDIFHASFLVLLALRVWCGVLVMGSSFRQRMRSSFSGQSRWHHASRASLWWLTVGTWLFKHAIFSV